MDLTKMQLLAWKTTFGKMNFFDDLEYLDPQLAL